MIFEIVMENYFNDGNSILPLTMDYYFNKYKVYCSILDRSQMIINRYRSLATQDFPCTPICVVFFSSNDLSIVSAYAILTFHVTDVGGRSNVRSAELILWSSSNSRNIQT